MSPLVTCEILGLFVNLFTADDKYSFRNTDNLRQPILMQLSKKQKTFSQFSAAFLNFRSNFELFGKKDDLHSLIISEIMDCQRRG